MKMKTFSVFTLALREGLDSVCFNAFKSIIPPLIPSNHKGMMGRIGVVGGSKDYTGAPFYGADGALRFGADLTFVFCSNEAAIPIKCYSPELMVSAFYDAAKIDDQTFIEAFAQTNSALEVYHFINSTRTGWCI